MLNCCVYASAEKSYLTKWKTRNFRYSHLPKSLYISMMAAVVTVAAGLTLYGYFDSSSGKKHISMNYSKKLPKCNVYYMEYTCESNVYVRQHRGKNPLPCASWTSSSKREETKSNLRQTNKNQSLIMAKKTS